MKRNSSGYPVRAMARVLGVSPSGYYAWLREEGRSCRTARTDVAVAAAFQTFRQRYGYRRIFEALNRSGHPMSRNTVQRSLQRQKLKARPVRRFVHTTDSRHKLPVCRNLLERNFTATAPNQKWAGDITYLWTRSGWVYLAFFLDLFSRKIVGWSLSRHIDGELATKALQEAVVRQGYPASVVVHTDRGSTYCADSYREYRDACNLLGSMSRKGNCWDNAVSESFIATLKREEEALDDLADDKAVYAVLFEFIECWYNTTRLHSTLGYMSPSEFEKKALPKMQERTLTTPSVF